MRLAEGPIWPVLADRACRPGRDAAGQGSGTVTPGDAGDDADDQARHRDIAARLCRRTNMNDRELVLTRLIDAPREKLYRAWTEPALLKQWFAPLPYTTPHAEMDVRPGGASLVVMRGLDGNDIRCPGVYLEVVPNARLVFTDAYTA